MLQNADRHVDGRRALSIEAFGPCAWKTLNAAFPVRKEHREQQVQACVSLPGKVLFTVGARDESVYIMIFRLIMQYVRDQDTDRCSGLSLSYSLMHISLLSHTIFRGNRDSCLKHACKPALLSAETGGEFNSWPHRSFLHLS